MKTILIPVIAYVAGAMSPAIISYIGKKTKELLAKIFSKSDSLISLIKDETTRALVKKTALDLVETAEHIIPDHGMGKDKFEAVDKLLIARFPILNNYAVIRKEIIEAACEIMWSADDELKKVIESK